MSEAVLDPHGHHYDDHAHEHHLGGPSMWPYILSVGIGLIAWGFAVSFATVRLGGIIMGLGAGTAVLGSILWWRTMIAEVAASPAGVADIADDQIIKDWKLGFLLFIGSEIMFFGAFFAFYFYSRINAPVWPPAGVHHLEKLLPAINTLLLVTSGFTFNWAHHKLRHGSKQAFHAGLIATLLLGTTFMGIQIYEYAHLEFALNSGLMGAAFYMLTGFHGAHVVVGLIMLATCLGRSMMNNHITAKRHFGVEATGWYWHFVDVVWIFLFLVLYAF